MKFTELIDVTCRGKRLALPPAPAFGVLHGKRSLAVGKRKRERGLAYDNNFDYTAAANDIERRLMGNDIYNGEVSIATSSQQSPGDCVTSRVAGRNEHFFIKRVKYVKPFETPVAPTFSTQSAHNHYSFTDPPKRPNVSINFVGPSDE